MILLGAGRCGVVSALRIVIVAVIGLQVLKIDGKKLDICSSWDNSRFYSVLREDVLAKLTPLLPFNLTSEQPSESDRNSSRNIDPAMLSAYEALSQVLSDRDSAEPASCSQPDGGRGTPAFAKRISLFFPETTNVSSSPLHRPDYSSQTSSQPIRYTYTFEPVLPSQTLYSAELRLFKKVISQSHDLFENVELFHVRKTLNEDEPERYIVNLKNVGLVNDEYESFDVLEAVKRWTEHSASGNDTLELEVIVNCPFSTKTGSFISPSIEFISDNSTMIDGDYIEARPQLVVATVNEEVATRLKRRRRKRRQIVDSDYCRIHPEAVNCCIRHLEVNFHTDLNLTTVLFPSNFTPNYCQGLCPIPGLGDNFLRHDIQNFYINNNIGNGACCTIYEMDPLLMMFRKNDQIVFLDVPNMEITSCGCVD